MKKIFLKAPARVEIFKEVTPGLPLPLQPVLTRWGTWLDAAIYHSKKFSILKEILDHLNEEESSAVTKCRELIKKSSLKNELAFISANYGFLSATITKLETSGLLLVDAIEIVEDARRKISAVSGNLAKIISQKMISVLSKNPNYEFMKKISQILKGNCLIEIENINTAEIASLKYAPMTSVDVERTFSKYKNLLATNRLKFTFEHLRRVVFLYCNNFEN